jgi:hypothetical protein
MLAGVKRDLDAADNAIGEKLRVKSTDNDGTSQPKALNPKP